ncbi:cell division protein FtsA [Desulfolucanica intricata]|uniref:cell division protein FtsA n=1 Tax=Desulfolucanica intricata TaxID=1285191 RepID=UPI000831DEA1|nr:cell division protein FtsA [Desulfolucanica intricata]
MPKNNEQLIMGLDVGASKITCAIGVVSSTGRITIWDAKEAPSLGWRKGTVIDADLAAVSLREAINPLRFTAGVEAASIQVGFSPQAIDTYRIKTAIPIVGREHRVTDDDIWEALTVIKKQTVLENRAILHMVPIEYYIDNQLVIEPLGKKGKILTVETIIITTPAEIVDNLINIVQQAGINVKETTLSSLASSEVLLNATDKEFGTVYVDVGGQTTDIAVYNRGLLKGVAVLPIGSDHITSDLAIGLRTSLACAERIKLQYGIQPDFSTGGVVEIDALTGGNKSSISCRIVVEIIEARVNEMLALIREAIASINHNGFVPSGIILGGRGALLPGLVEFAEKGLSLPVRLRKPQVYLKPGTKIDTTAYSAAIGLIKYRSVYIRDKSSRHTRSFNSPLDLSSLMGKFKTWIHEHF